MVIKNPKKFEDVKRVIRYYNSMGKHQSPPLLPLNATRRNTACDRKGGYGSIAFSFSGMKKAGAGRANWGKPGDELFDYDDDIDYTLPSAEEALAAAAGLEWSEVVSLSDEDQDNMDALEEAMCEDWLRAQEEESRQIQDEGEDFFNSLDPRSWVE